MSDPVGSKQPHTTPALAYSLQPVTHALQLLLEQATSQGSCTVGAPYAPQRQGRWHAAVTVAPAAAHTRHHRSSEPQPTRRSRHAPTAPDYIVATQPAPKPRPHQPTHTKIWATQCGTHPRPAAVCLAEPRVLRAWQSHGGPVPRTQQLTDRPAPQRPIQGPHRRTPPVQGCCACATSSAEQ